MDEFMSPGLRQLIEHSTIDHLESNGEAILTFNNKLRKAKNKDFEKLVSFSKSLMKLIDPERQSKEITQE
jgi:hypothetical protein